MNANKTRSSAEGSWSPQQSQGPQGLRGSSPQHQQEGCCLQGMGCWGWGHVGQTGLLQHVWEKEEGSGVTSVGKGHKRG